MPQPLSYHLQVLQHFKEQPKTWDFFSANTTRQSQLNTFKLELLKNTYKFSADADKNIYDKVETAKSKLGLEDLSVSVYQVQFSEELNASIVYGYGEAHIVFSGSIIKLLGDDELLAVIAHELSHVRLYRMLNGEVEIADRLITAVANNRNAEPAYYETARLFRLYTEIFCDRGALTVLGDTTPVITSLVKIATGLSQVSAESYLNQAEEIFKAEASFQSNTVSHPENFIRARALQLWHTNGGNAEKEIEKMIQGRANLNQLDIFQQQSITDLTNRFIRLFLKPKWFQTVLARSHAKQFFPQLVFEDDVALTEDFVTQLKEAHESVREYFSYLLLDFIMVDPSLELVPFGWAFQFAEDVQLKENFEAVVKKEFSFSDKKLRSHREKALNAYYEIKEGAAEQIYQD